MVGYKPVDGGHSDPECTHVILSLTEYDKLLQKMRNVEAAGIKAQKDADDSVAKVKADAAKEIQRILAEAERKLAEMARRLETEHAAKIYHMGLNERLLQISRERANADRDIRPKKERSGYVVLSSRQKKYRYKENRRDWGEVYLWETVIQTPYVVAFTAEQAMTETQELFARDEQGHWLLGKLGISGERYGKYEEIMGDPEYEGRNMIVDRNYTANAKAGYWEINITHTKPLDNIGTELP